MSKRTDTIRALFTKSPEAKGAGGMLSADNMPLEGQRRPAGAVNAIRGTFSDIERENESLRSAAAAGERIVEIAARLIDPSPFPDRFQDDGDPSFEALKASISERGQEVPVLLRPHPAAAGRYQTAFGHRRIRALAALGRPVRALVRELSDDDLAAAQGVENAARADLSFIERAVFAMRLEEAGRSRAVIQQALAIDRAETSKLIAVARGIPPGIAAAIGRAPRAGRPRWQELAEALKSAAALKRVQGVAAQLQFKERDSGSRFLAVLAAAKRSPEAATERKPVKMAIKAQSGETIARITDGGGISRIEIDRIPNAAFADFVAEELPALYARFSESASPSARGRRS